jgi:hypothetical protein
MHRPPWAPSLQSCAPRPWPDLGWARLRGRAVLQVNFKYTRLHELGMPQLVVKAGDSAAPPPTPPDLVALQTMDRCAGAAQ